jgi:hypothetical protein
MEKTHSHKGYLHFYLQSPCKRARCGGMQWVLGRRRWEGPAWWFPGPGERVYFVKRWTIPERQHWKMTLAHTQPCTHKKRSSIRSCSHTGTALCAPWRYVCFPSPIDHTSPLPRSRGLQDSWLCEEHCMSFDKFKKSCRTLPLSHNSPFSAWPSSLSQPSLIYCLHSFASSSMWYIWNLSVIFSVSFGLLLCVLSYLARSFVLLLQNSRDWIIYKEHKFISYHSGVCLQRANRSAA